MAADVDDALVEGLRVAVPLHILQLTGHSRAELLAIAAGAGQEAGHKGDSLQFPAKSTAGRRTTAHAFNALARGLAAAAHLHGTCDAFGVHWCTRDHAGCPRRPDPASGIRPMGYQEMADRAVAILDDFEQLLGPSGTPERPDRTIDAVLAARPSLAAGRVEADGSTVTYTYAHGAPERDLVDAALHGRGNPPLRWVKDWMAEWVLWFDEDRPERTYRYPDGLSHITLTGHLGGQPLTVRAVPAPKEGPVSEPHPLITQLKAARTAMGLSVAKLAARGGYSEQTIRSWESGKSAPNLDNLDDYAAAVGLDVVLQPTAHTTTEDAA
ncbi:helix-turn-helix transcriptional regulator [Nocardiopsis sp. YSL2]|uniref:helix-turn-helix domain-containing protein n=1 Tax=Nocardiopsis sp. YSL2 TaxID=2939492 RepID=UPI0026F43E39|nr:helix-turn-helix transcriptional regulator [Nocardiopsis sp. YSL2]